MFEINTQLMFRNGQSNRNLDIQEGESVAFMVVFSDPPEDFQNYSVKVAGYEQEKI